MVFHNKGIVLKVWPLKSFYPFSLQINDLSTYKTKIDAPPIEHLLNDNIKRLERNGSFSNWATGTIDNLFYHYNGNQLIAVDDHLTTTQPSP